MRNKTSPKAVARAKLIDNAILMRVSGSSYKMISEALATPVPTVHRWVKRYIETKPLESAAELRALLLERLDLLCRVHAPMMATPASARVMISAIEASARIG